MIETKVVLAQVPRKKLIAVGIRKLFLDATHQAAPHALSLQPRMNDKPPNMAAGFTCTGSNGADDVRATPCNQEFMAGELRKQAFQRLG
jgi:hypothetical protein